MPDLPSPLPRGFLQPRSRPVPNTDSAKKRVTQNVDRAARNRWRRNRVKTQEKLFLAALHDGDKVKAEAEFRKVASILDRVGTTSTMHRNTVARRKSRLAARLNALAKKS